MESGVNLTAHNAHNAGGRLYRKQHSQVGCCRLQCICRCRDRPYGLFQVSSEKGLHEPYIYFLALLRAGPKPSTQAVDKEARVGYSEHSNTACLRFQATAFLTATCYEQVAFIISLKSHRVNALAQMAQ